MALRLGVRVFVSIDKRVSEVFGLSPTYASSSRTGRKLRCAQMHRSTSRYGVVATVEL